MTPIDVVVLKCRKICRLEILKSFAIYRTKKQISDPSQTVAMREFRPKYAWASPQQ